MSEFTPEQDAYLRREYDPDSRFIPKIEGKTRAAVRKRLKQLNLYKREPIPHWTTEEIGKLTEMCMSKKFTRKQVYNAFKDQRSKKALDKQIVRLGLNSFIPKSPTVFQNRMFKPASLTAPPDNKEQQVMRAVRKHGLSVYKKSEDVYLAAGREYSLQALEEYKEKLDRWATQRKWL